MLNVKATRIIVLLLVVMLLLTGCFRQASPDFQPPPATITPTPLPPTLPPASPVIEPTDMPFVTPIATDEGLDVDSMPTLEDPTATLVLADADGIDEAGVLPAESPTPGPTSTIPFVAGPTYTPRPGHPTIDPNAPEDSLFSTPVPDEIDEDGSGLTANCTYFVQSGDTAFGIALEFGVTLEELIDHNRLENADRLEQGQELAIPNCGENADATSTATLEGQPPVATSSIVQDVIPSATRFIAGPEATPTSVLPPPVDENGNAIHVIQPGENLFRIAQRYGVTVNDIVVANNLGSQNATLLVGQELLIPIGTDEE